MAVLEAIAIDNPNDETAQMVAAYEAWLQGQHDLAIRFAEKADHLFPEGFAALLVLTAVHSRRGNDATTYHYAKRLASAKRRDKQVLALGKLLANAGILGTDDLSNVQRRAEIFADWIAWSEEFVRHYESSADA